MGWLITIAASLLALSIAPVAPTCSNDGSHLALAKSLSEGRVALGGYAGMASVDHAERDGVIYSDRAPGLAFALVPVLWLGLDPRLVSAAAFGGTLGLLYAWLRRDGCSVAASATTVVVGATTVMLRFAPVLFAHSLAAFLLTFSGWVVTGPSCRGWVLGLALGWAGITEYALAALAVVAALVAWRRWPSYYAGLAVPVAAAGLYQWIAFGAPWRSGYAYQATFEAARSFSGNFAGPLWPGLQSFVLLGPDSWGFPNFGLLTISPVLALAPLGLLAYGLRHRWQAVLLGAVCVAYLLLYSKFVAFAAGTADSRYYVPFLPLLLLGLGHLLNSRAPWSYIVVALLTLAGAETLTAHISHSMGWQGSLGFHWPP